MEQQMEQQIVQQMAQQMEQQIVQPLYLYYSINISPVDEIASVIKEKINLEELSKSDKTLKDEDVRTFFRNKGCFCPIPNNKNVTTYYCEFEENEHEVKVLFYKFNDADFNNDDLKVSLHRTINIVHNYLTEYEVFFKLSLKKLLKDLSEIHRDSSIISKMKFIENDSFDINLKNLNDKVLVLNNNVAYSYYKQRMLSYSEINKSRKIKGGLLIKNNDDNKILQILSMVSSEPSTLTLVIASDDSKKKWLDIMNSNFGVNLTSNINIIGFTEFNDLIQSNQSNQLNNYDRIILDDFEYCVENHLSNVFNYLRDSNSKYKWILINSDDFINENLLSYLFSTVIEFDNNEEKYVCDNYVKSRHFYDFYRKTIIY